MSRIALLLAAVLIAGCASIGAAPPEIVKELAPTGRLRAALADNDPVGREVARQLARRLKVRLQTTTFDAPFDIALVLPEEARGAQLDFTAPYVILDGRPRVIAVARGRPEAGDYLRNFLDELKDSGVLAQAIEANSVKDRASVP